MKRTNIDNLLHIICYICNYYFLFFVFFRGHTWIRTGREEVLIWNQSVGWRSMIGELVKGVGVLWQTSTDPARSLSLSLAPKQGEYGSNHTICFHGGPLVRGYWSHSGITGLKHLLFTLCTLDGYCHCPFWLSNVLGRRVTPTFTTPLDPTNSASYVCLICENNPRKVGPLTSLVQKLKA